MDLSLPYVWVADMVRMSSLEDCAMKTTLNLDDQVLMNAKKRASQDGVTLTRFVEDALKAKLLPAYRRGLKFKLKPTVVEGTRSPNVDISNRDALYNVIDNE